MSWSQTLPFLNEPIERIGYEIYMSLTKKQKEEWGVPHFPKMKKPKLSRTQQIILTNNLRIQKAERNKRK